MKKIIDYNLALEMYLLFLKNNKLFDKKKNFNMKTILKNFKIGQKRILKKNCPGILRLKKKTKQKWKIFISKK